MDRSQINRALAKAMAYEQCGKPRERDQWARELVRLLGAAGILRHTEYELCPDNAELDLTV